MAALPQIHFNSARVQVIHGVTDSGAADTALSTLPPHKFGHNNVLAIALGEGVYVEDDGSVAPRQSGVTSTTVDVRSSGTSKYFVCLVFELGGGSMITLDHSATTT